jgi:hypothetical protein
MRHRPIAKRAEPARNICPVHGATRVSSPTPTANLGRRERKEQQTNEVIGRRRERYRPLNVG